jgi:PBP1b-binding outer membrane lipoprotein LpoB
MRNRISNRVLCLALTALFAVGCSQESQGPAPETKAAPIYAGGSTTPPEKVGGKTVKRPKIINMTPTTTVVP